MRQKHCFALFVLTTLAIGGPWVIAQEPEAPAADTAESTDSDNPYFDLRKSTDRVTRQWAERYFNLVKFQEWASDKGTTIKAKYISHKADLSSVTLLVVRGSGASRVEREVAVPVAKLSKSGQSRVKQIDVTQKKLDELIAGGATGGLDGQTPGQPSVDAGAPMNDEQGAEPRPRRSTTRTRTSRPRETAAAPASPTAPTTNSTIADDGNPDPLGFADLSAPSGSPMKANIGLPAALPDSAPDAGDVQPVQEVSREEQTDALGSRLASASGENGPTGPPKPWQTDYEAFRENFKVAQSESGEPTIDFGDLNELRIQAEAARALYKPGTAEDKKRMAANVNAARKRMGDIEWTATLRRVNTSNIKTIKFDLPPLPEPLDIDFWVDTTDAQAPKWDQFSEGDRVHFKGKVQMINETSVVVQVREPVLAPSDDAR